MTQFTPALSAHCTDCVNRLICLMGTPVRVCVGCGVVAYRRSGEALPTHCELVLYSAVTHSGVRKPLCDDARASIASALFRWRHDAHYFPSPECGFARPFHTMSGHGGPQTHWLCDACWQDELWCVIHEDRVDEIIQRADREDPEAGLDRAATLWTASKRGVHPKIKRLFFEREVFGTPWVVWLIWALFAVLVSFTVWYDFIR